MDLKLIIQENLIINLMFKYNEYISSVLLRYSYANKRYGSKLIKYWTNACLVLKGKTADFFFLISSVISSLLPPPPAISKKK